MNRFFVNCLRRSCVLPHKALFWWFRVGCSVRINGTWVSERHVPAVRKNNRNLRILQSCWLLNFLFRKAAKSIWGAIWWPPIIPIKTSQFSTQSRFDIIQKLVFPRNQLVYEYLLKWFRSACNLVILKRMQRILHWNSWRWFGLSTGCDDSHSSSQDSWMFVAMYEQLCSMVMENRIKYENNVNKLMDASIVAS